MGEKNEGNVAQHVDFINYNAVDSAYHCQIRQRFKRDDKRPKRAVMRVLRVWIRALKSLWEVRVSRK